MLKSKLLDNFAVPTKLYPTPIMVEGTGAGGITFIEERLSTLILGSLKFSQNFIGVKD